MSLRYWNSVGERLRLSRMVHVACLRISESSDEDLEDEIGSADELDEVSVDSEPSSDEESEDELTPMDISGLNSTVESEDTVDVLIDEVIAEASRIFSPMETEDIDFDRPFVWIAHVDASTCDLEFRFWKDELQLVANLLWPRMALFLDGTKESITCANRYSCPYETGFLICLFRLSRPRRMRPEMESYFAMRKSHISACLKTFMAALYEVSKPYLNSPARWRSRMAMYARKIRRKSKCDGISVWGFIDGTVRKTCRPSRFQRLLYSGHKRVHGIKFQSVVTPDGFIALLFGPIPGNRHDSHMLRDSQLLAQLEALFPEGEQFYSLYGDPAYPQSRLLFGGFRYAAPNSAESKWNKRMSSVRESVEWLYGGILSKWSFLDFRSSMRVFKIPVAQYYQAGALLTNIHNALHSSETGVYFKCATPDQGMMTVQQYVNMVPLDEYLAEDNNA